MNIANFCIALMWALIAVFLANLNSESILNQSLFILYSLFFFFYFMWKFLKEVYSNENTRTER